jgi:hypothetical protein
MPSKSGGVNYGEYALIGGLVLAVILGVLSSFVPEGLMPLLVAVLFVLGLVVGLLNVSEKEVNSFLIAGVALLLAATSWNVALAGSLALLGDAGVMVAKMVVGFTNALIAFLSPAIFIVAITGIWKLAKPD